MVVESSEISTPPATDTSSAIPTSLITINVATQLPIKLTPTNYPSWRAQFSAMLLSYDFMGYVDGSGPSPPATQAVSHAFWIRQDQLLLYAILTLVSPQVISFIASTKASKEA